jgi:hypothetical protein
MPGEKAVRALAIATEKAAAGVMEQQQWIEGCGGDILGYIKRYDTAAQAEAIFKADYNELMKRWAIFDRLAVVR